MKTIQIQACGECRFLAFHNGSASKSCCGKLPHYPLVDKKTIPDFCPLPDTVPDYPNLPVMRDCVDLWGVQTQFNMTVGELGELLTLVGRREQGRDTDLQWIEEISDGLMMLYQLAHIFGPERVAVALKIKLEALEEMVAQEKERRKIDGRG